MGEPNLWAAVLAAAAGCFLLKWAGLSLPPHLLARPAVRRVATLMPVSLLAALLVTQVLALDGELVPDARLAGIGFAVVALVLRAPFLVVVVGAAAVTALVRLL